MTGMIASRNYYPGDLICREEPFAQVLPRKLKDVLCESCGESSPFLKACKECLSVKYCGKLCQRKDWNSHKFECKYLKNLPEGSNEDTVRLLGKIILKTKGKQWKNIKRRILGTEFSFDDIDSHYKDMTEKPLLNLQYKELRVLTRSYIGEENMPSDVVLIKIVGKMKFNTYLISAKSICFYIGLLLFERECIPNSNFSQNGSVLKIWANRKISKGVDKITVPSRMFLSNIRIFGDDKECPCECTDCSLPYGESVLTKIIDPERAYSVIKETENLLKMATVFTGLDMESCLKKDADTLLKKQEGVLGNSNSLRLRLFAFRYLQIGDHAFAVIRPLMQLEKYTGSVYGEYSLEMKPIYELLVTANARTGNLEEWFYYMRKVFKLHESQSE